ncbi:uncharacterized protein Dwil_GK22897 [Drosophila willistoni]|uniref:Lethal hybrid rescue protein n=1 Tax=Drosophila willistoni TaxID=7260 RepID=A0PKA9_DROWI|nr:uncharacterized protein LOC6652320 [Drosophila willistoni]EDW85896.1 uncharacterized protein Dwil_GK22897 [Drosophila willistoni]DAA05827.1 TPA_inf: lethal hybrid rescue protein [Drosophila willistoni]
MDSDDLSSQIELNITNKNENGQIVLNDLRLLELLHMYPYLFSKQVRPQQDADYDEWGWQQIAKQFNASYENLNLSAPFSVEELQWRWDILRPLLATLSKHFTNIPPELASIMQKISQMLNAQKPHNVKTSLYGGFLLDQLPFVEALSQLQRRRLEVEIVDAILQTELHLKTPVLTSSKDKELVQSEYDAFLKDIRVKELPSDTLHRLATPAGGLFLPANHPSSVNLTNVSTDMATSSKNNIVSNEHTNLVISSVYTATPSPSEFAAPKQPSPLPAAQPSPPPCIIKVEPPDEMDPTPQSIPPAAPTISIKPDQPPVRFVPIKSAKYYVKKVRVLMKRQNLDDFIPLAKIRRRRR